MSIDDAPDWARATWASSAADERAARSVLSLVEALRSLERELKRRAGEKAETAADWHRLDPVLSFAPDIAVGQVELLEQSTREILRYASSLDALLDDVLSLCQELRRNREALAAARVVALRVAEGAGST